MVGGVGDDVAHAGSLSGVHHLKAVDAGAPLESKQSGAIRIVAAVVGVKDSGRDLGMMGRIRRTSQLDARADCDRLAQGVYPRRHVDDAATQSIDVVDGLLNGRRAIG